MAQITKALAESILNDGDGVTRNEVEQLCYFFLNRSWIDRKVTPPTHEEGKKIIAYGGYVFECESVDGTWCNLGGDNFTHWMPYFSPPN